jgi:hypothetical protein
MKSSFSRAVCRFAVSALAHGEGVILVPTAPHWNALRPRLEAEGVDTDAAQKSGQLTVVDADHLLPIGVVERESGDGMIAAITLLNEAGTHFQRRIGVGHGFIPKRT